MTPILQLLIGMAGLAQPTPVETRIVFAALRFGENLGNLYELGASHLYSIKTDGTDVRQITTGDFADIRPRVSLDGKHLLFWRSIAPNEEYVRRYRLLSIDFDGRDLRRVGRAESDEPSDGLALALERSSQGLERTVSSIRKDGWSVFRDAVGLLYNPSGTRVMTLANWDENTDAFVGDLRTRRIVRIPGKYRQPIWIDDDRVIAFVGKSTKNLAILDMRGRQVASAVMPDTDEDLEGYARSSKAYKLGSRGIVILQFHHSMSDGGYDYTERLNLRQHKSRPFDAATIEGVSRHGWMFVDDVFHWVGGYKGPGAAKVGRMTLVNERTHESKPIGFRRMICRGACFIPR
jgi:hypothetical protein